MYSLVLWLYLNPILLNPHIAIPNTAHPNIIPHRTNRSIVGSHFPFQPPLPPHAKDANSPISDYPIPLVWLPLLLEYIHSQCSYSTTPSEIVCVLHFGRVRTGIWRSYVFVPRMSSFRRNVRVLFFLWNEIINAWVLDNTRRIRVTMCSFFWCKNVYVESQLKGPGDEKLMAKIGF